MKKFLLTGATGVVGLSLLELLKPDDEITLITHSRSFSKMPIGVHAQLKGDIRKVNLALNDTEIEALKNSVDCIVHCAALTNFTADPEQLAQYNLVGVQNMIALAKRLDKPLFYVSTAFVHQRNQHDLNHYEYSKKQAEMYLETIDYPVTIIRPSIIVGHSQDGSMPAKQGMHNMMRLAAKELLPVIPGKAHAIIDVIPRDIVAKAILSIVEHKLSGEYWLTAGNKSAKFSQLLNLGLDEKCKTKYKFSFKPPKLVHPEVFERLIKPVFMPALPRKFKKMFNNAVIYLKYLDMTEPFPSSMQELAKITASPLDFSVLDVMAKNFGAFERSSKVGKYLVANQQGLI